MDSRGLTSRAEGDLGPVYGFQWRHWGEKYISSRSHYKGIDQLRLCEKMLIEDPYSRRIIMTAWNPSQINEMALPPCHILIQWYVDYSEKLWLQFYQRSGDMFLGIPFNMFSYSVLLHIMALRTGLSPGGVVHCIGDAHVYENHVDAVKKQLKNNIHPSPTINIRSSRTSVFDDGTGTQVSMRRQKDWNEYIEDSIKFLKKLEPVARDNNIKIAIENHQDFDSNDFLKTVNELLFSSDCNAFCI